MTLQAVGLDADEGLIPGAPPRFFCRVGRPLAHPGRWGGRGVRFPGGSDQPVEPMICEIRALGWRMFFRCQSGSDFFGERLRLWCS